MTDTNATKSDANATTDTTATDPQPGPVGLTGDTAKAEAKQAKKAPAKKKATTKATKKSEPSTPKASTGGKSVRKRITAPARLEKLKEQWRSGNLPSNIAVSNSGGSFKAFEFVKE